MSVIRIRAVVLMLIVVCGCGGAPATTPTLMPSALQGPYQLAGTIVGNQNGQPVGGVRFTLSNGREETTVITDSDGQFRHSSIPAGRLVMSLEASGYLTHTASLDVTGSNTDLAFSVIATSPPFSLEFYRQFARDTLRGTSRATNPWTVEPSVYLRTVTDDTGESIPATIVSAIRRVFANSIPELSDGRLAMAAFEVGTEPRPNEDGWVIVTFARDPGPFNARSSYVGGNRGRVVLKYWRSDDPVYSLNNTLACEAPSVEAADHEIVHVMGFYHTATTFTDFQSGVGCPGDGRPVRTLHHASVMYSRPPGNLDPDVNPASAAYQSIATSVR